MHLETITCNNCGAPLEVPDTANYVKCSHCHSQLVIRRTATAVFTEQLQQISRKQDQLSEQMTELIRQNQLAALERRWDRDKEQFMVTDKRGNRSEPNAAVALVMGGIVAAFGVFWTVTAASMGAPGFFPLFGLMFVAVAVWGMTVGYRKAGEYQSARRRYETRRRDLLNKTSFDDDIPENQTPEGYLRSLSDEDNGGKW